MNKYDIEEAEFLKMRSWDLIERLENLNSELEQAKNIEQRNIIRKRIERTKALYKEYQDEYQEIAREIGLDAEDIGSSEKDFIELISKKTAVSEQDLKLRTDIGEIGRFFSVPKDKDPKFTGRQDEVFAFAQRLIRGGAFAITGAKGMGGIGKTAIANEVCHLLRQTWEKEPNLPEYIRPLLSGKRYFPDGILWIQFERGIQNLKTLTEKILRDITDPATAAKIENLRTLGDILSKKQVLVVLDSVEQNMRSFHHVFESLKGRACILITSRIEIPGIHAINIDKLTDNEAFSLFVRRLKNPNVNESQKQQIQELCQILGNFPLAITIVASRADENNSNFDALKTAYQHQKLAFLDARGLGLDVEERNLNVKTCFAMSYQELSEQEQKLFRYAGVFRDPFSEEDLAAVAELENIADALQNLIGASFIQSIKSEDGAMVKYQLHPLMREFALDLIAEHTKADPSRKEQNRQLLEKVEKLKKDGVLKQALYEDKGLLKEISAAMRECDAKFDFETVIKFMDCINLTISGLGFWEDKILLNRMTIKATIAVQNRDREVWYRSKLADTLSRTYHPTDMELSRNEFNKALNLYIKIQNINQAFFIQYSLADIEYRLNHYSECVAMNFKGVREACRYVNYFKTGNFLRTIGWIYRECHFDNAFPLLRANVRQKSWEKYLNKPNYIRSLTDLVGIKQSKGKIDECLDLYLKLLILFQILQVSESIKGRISDLFNCYSKLRNTEECEKLILAYRSHAHQLRISKGEIFFKEGLFAFLKKDFQAALQYFSSAKEEYLNKQEIDYWIGKIYLYNHEPDKAEPYLRYVLTYCQKERLSVQTSSVYTQLAFWELQRNHIPQAIEYLSQSVKTKQKFGIEYLLEEEEIKQQILDKIRHDNLDPDLYAEIEAKTQPIDLKPIFLIDNLPDSFIAKDGKEMMLIPEGTAFIGEGKIIELTMDEILSNIDRLIEFEQSPDKSEKSDPFPKSDEPEATEIYLYPYYIDKKAVTNAEYRRFCEEVNHPLPDHWIENDIPGDLPVVNISLEDAKTYAKWAGKELPTEAEWEKACRGEKGLFYPWGDVWNPEFVKNKSGEIRQQFDKEYDELNSEYHENCGIFILRTHRFTIPPHPNTTFDEQELLSFLEGSVNLSVREKEETIHSIPKLNQIQIDEIQKKLHEEKQEFMKLNQTQSHAARKRSYIEMMSVHLAETYHKTSGIFGDNLSPYKVSNMVGHIFEMTISQEENDFFIKGGSWFSADPENACRAFNRERVKALEKRMDVGFRCVKPIFSKKDLPE